MQSQAVGVVPVLYRRTDVTPEEFSRYWCDIHGTFNATFVGPWRYRTLHFAAYDPALWGSDSVDQALVEERQLGGIAEFVFADDADRVAWSQVIGSFSDADEPAVFRRAACYNVPEGGYAEPRAGDIAEIDDETPRLYAMLQAKAPGADFAAYVAERLAPAIAAVSGVTRVQSTCYDPYEATYREYTAGEDVDRSLSTDEQHQAALEIAFNDEAALEAFCRGGLDAVENGIAAQVARVHAYRVRHAYLHVSDAAMTLTGWLGAPRAQIVRRVGAQNIVDALAPANERRLADNLGGRRG